MDAALDVMGFALIVGCSRDQDGEVGSRFHLY
jgi:hypothetical protein